VGRDNEIFGSLRAREGITVGAGTEVAGDVTTRGGTVRVGPDTNVRGDISGEYVEVHHEATVEGAIRAREEMSMVSEPVIDDAVVDETAEDDSETDDTAADDPQTDDTTNDDVAADGIEADDGAGSAGRGEAVPTHEDGSGTD